MEEEEHGTDDEDKRVVGQDGVVDTVRLRLLYHFRFLDGGNELACCFAYWTYD